MKRIVIVGATSGIGMEVAKMFLQNNYQVGIAGRRKERLDILKNEFPENCFTEVIDVTQVSATENLLKLIEQLGGMDVFFLSSGIGNQNMTLNPEIELATANTNATGFIRMTTAAFNYFSHNCGGQIAVISSIAGTKGLGAAPAYSATKRMQNIYIDALEQQAKMRKLNICFTDIRPGFVETDLLKYGKYPLLMKPKKVAKSIFWAVVKKKRRIIIDWRYKILVFFWKMIPNCLWKSLSIASQVQ
ncbi:MAG: SDR family NAD(P)-dependent oxidoreductase [Bacteroidales bacterium]|jgi:short-subunit dehydrogenase|nr:SDR family NAD(P)-dependent oxidoreductase [Bacteroidales bacterium]